MNILVMCIVEMKSGALAYTARTSKPTGTTWRDSRDDRHGIRGRWTTAPSEILDS